MTRAACLGPAEPHAQLTTKQGARWQGTRGPTPDIGLARAPHLPSGGTAMPPTMGRPPSWTSLSLGGEDEAQTPPPELQRS